MALWRLSHNQKKDAPVGGVALDTLSHNHVVAVRGGGVAGQRKAHAERNDPCVHTGGVAGQREDTLARAAGAVTYHAASN